MSEKDEGENEKIVIEIMPKRDLLDPQGKAVAAALSRMGHRDIAGVRIGKRIELHLNRTASADDVEEAKQLAAEFLSNGVIEDVVAIKVERSS